MAALWGAAWPSGKVVAAAVPAFSASSWRFALSLLLLLGWLFARSGPRTLRALSARQWAGLALGGALGVFGYAAFFLMGLQHLPAGRSLGRGGEPLPHGKVGNCEVMGAKTGSVR